MEKYIQTVTFEEARLKVMKIAYDNLNEFLNNKEIDVLEDRYLEEECCWFFFRNRKIQGPSESVLKWDCAYAVSKKGEVRTIADLSNEPDRLNEYLIIMSNYFKEHGI